MIGRTSMGVIQTKSQKRLKGGKVMMEKSKGLDRRHFMKMAALAAGSAVFAGRIPFAVAQQITNKEVQYED